MICTEIFYFIQFRFRFGPAVGAEKTKFMSKEAFFKLINLFFSTEDYSPEQLTLIWDHKVSDKAKKNGLELAEFSRIFADPTPSEERPNSTNWLSRVSEKMTIEDQ